jgi:uncharacterized membrane protein
MYTYRRDLLASSQHPGSGVFALGPVFIAASLAAFAGEHFTAARQLAELVPKWMPARVFIAYFVGVALFAAALSLVARRCIRWSTIFLAIMFGLFVLLLHLPGAISNPAIRIGWIVTVRETTFALGAFALFGIAVQERRPALSKSAASIARFWAGMVIVFFGFEHILYPQYSPGVPDSLRTASWVPFPLALAYLTGILLIAFGIAMVVRKYASSAGAFTGLLLLVLTISLYVPQYFLVRSVPERVTAINFVADTLLFAGTMLVIANAILRSETPSVVLQPAG